MEFIYLETCLSSCSFSFSRHTLQVALWPDMTLGDLKQKCLEELEVMSESYEFHNEGFCYESAISAINELFQGFDLNKVWNASEGLDSDCEMDSVYSFFKFIGV